MRERKRQVVLLSAVHMGEAKTMTDRYSLSMCGTMAELAIQPM